MRLKVDQARLFVIAVEYNKGQRNRYAASPRANRKNQTNGEILYDLPHRPWVLLRNMPVA